MAADKRPYQRSIELNDRGQQQWLVVQLGLPALPVLGSPDLEIGPAVLDSASTDELDRAQTLLKSICEQRELHLEWDQASFEVPSSSRESQARD